MSYLHVFPRDSPTLSVSVPTVEHLIEFLEGLDRDHQWRIPPQLRVMIQEDTDLVEQLQRYLEQMRQATELFASLGVESMMKQVKLMFVHTELTQELEEARKTFDLRRKAFAHLERAAQIWTEINAETHEYDLGRKLIALHQRSLDYIKQALTQKRPTYKSDSMYPFLEHATKTIEFYWLREVDETTNDARHVFLAVYDQQVAACIHHKHQRKLPYMSAAEVLGHLGTALRRLFLNREEVHKRLYVPLEITQEQDIAVRAYKLRELFLNLSRK